MDGWRSIRRLFVFAADIDAREEMRQAHPRDRGGMLEPAVHGGAAFGLASQDDLNAALVDHRPVDGPRPAAERGEDQRTSDEAAG
jgi:hypothetical protein